MRGSDMYQAIIHFDRREVKIIETENAVLQIIKGDVVLLEVKKGKTLDFVQARHCLNILEKFMGTTFSLVFNRSVNEKSQYGSLYEAIDGRRFVKKIAVVWNDLGLDWKECGTVCKKRVSVFRHVDDAISWAHQLN